MYSGAIMSAKLRSSQRAHKSHCTRALTHNYPTPQYYDPKHKMSFRAGHIPSTNPNTGQICRNMSIFSGGPKNQEEANSGDGENLDQGTSLFPRRSQAKRQWSIQAVKGKVTTSCLWNACKALTFGTLLIFIGAGMATIGEYALIRAVA